MSVSQKTSTLEVKTSKMRLIIRSIMFLRLPYISTILSRSLQNLPHQYSTFYNLLPATCQFLPITPGTCAVALTPAPRWQASHTQGRCCPELCQCPVGMQLPPCQSQHVSMSVPRKHRSHSNWNKWRRDYLERDYFQNVREERGDRPHAVM